MTTKVVSEDHRSQSAKIAQIEDDLSSLKGDMGSLRGEFNTLGERVRGLSEDIAASSRSQEKMHGESLRRLEAFQAKWQDQKDAEQKSRQIGPAQAFQIAGVLVMILGAAGGLFFFMTKAYLDGSITPLVAELTRIAGDNRNALTEQNARLRALELSDARSDERQKAETAYRDMQIGYEAKIRDLQDGVKP